MRIRRCGAPFVLVLLILAPMLSVGHVAAAPTPRAQEKPAFRLTNGPPLPHLRTGSLVITRHGTEHVLASDSVATGPPRWEPQYLTRRPGTRVWIDHPLPGHLSLGGSAQIFTTLSSGGRRVLAAIDICAGNELFTMAAPARSSRLPRPKIALADRNYSCNDGEGLDLVGAAPASHGRLALLFQNGEGGTIVPLVSVGRPGQPFPPAKPLANPGRRFITAAAITRDPQTGNLIAIGNGGKGVYAWTKRPHHGWGHRHLIVPGHGPGRYTATSVSADGAVVVGLAPWSFKTHHTGQAIVIRRHNAWSKPETVPHSGIGDYGLVDFDRARHAIHFVFNHFRHGGHTMGLRQVVRRAKRWSPARRMTRRAFDHPLGISLTRAGHVVVAYHFDPAP
jgi:hypothetical protein